MPTTITFDWKVSSEAGKDKLAFYVDGEEKGRIDGDVDWTRVEFAVPAGLCELEWRYAKDAAGSAGSDCGWVDNIVISGIPPAAGEGLYGFSDFSDITVNGLPVTELLYGGLPVTTLAQLENYIRDVRINEEAFSVSGDSPFFASRTSSVYRPGASRYSSASIDRGDGPKW